MGALPKSMPTSAQFPQFCMILRLWCWGYMHAGLKSMKERVEIKLGPYVWDLMHMHRKQDKVLKNVFSLFTSHQIIHGHRK